MKRKRGRIFLFSALGLIVLLGLGIFGGYQSGISIRKNAESSSLMERLGEQFQYALVDFEFGRYENAKQRLEFVIAEGSLLPRRRRKN
ncbi:MAG: hypothetical protein M0C28_36775 [Candidatus Moduliflexus flocculans]|nr:hypothetical protein [Candidatus Moduliflexus flocculans]